MIEPVLLKARVEVEVAVTKYGINCCWNTNPTRNVPLLPEAVEAEVGEAEAPGFVRQVLTSICCLAKRRRGTYCESKLKMRNSSC